MQEQRRSSAGAYRKQARSKARVGQEQSRAGGMSWEEQGLELGRSRAIVHCTAKAGQKLKQRRSWSWEKEQGRNRPGQEQDISKAGVG